MRTVPSGEIATKAFMSTTGAAGLVGEAAATAPPSVAVGVMHPVRTRPPPAAEARRKKRRELFTVSLLGVSSAMDQASRVSLGSTPAAVLIASRMRTYVPHRQ